MRIQRCWPVLTASLLWMLFVQDTCDAATSNNVTSQVCFNNNDCGQNAYCSAASECKCAANYTGQGCSVSYQFCPNGEDVCYNGGECIQSTVKDAVTQTLHTNCDCSHAFTISQAAGVECQNSNFESCVQGTIVSNYAYCSNGGVCKSFILDGDPDPGCYCPAGYSGLHCQNAPAGAQSSSSSGGGKLSGLMKLYIVLLVIGGTLSLVVLGIIIHRRRIRDKFQKESSESLQDLHLGADGENSNNATGLKVEDVEIS